MNEILHLLFKSLRFAVLAVFCGLSFMIQGQNTDRFERFSTLNGLGNNSIFDINTDPNGFIWLATYDGLSRYDGYEFVNFKPDQSNPQFAGSNIINVLEPDSLGHIWFGTKGTGLSAFNPSTGYYKNYLTQGRPGQQLSGNDVLAICHTPKQVWIGTRTGLDILNTETDSVQSFSLTAYGVFNGVTSLVQGEKGYIWVGSNQGLLLVKLENNRLKLHPSGSVRQLISNKSIRHIYKDDNNNYWIVTPHTINCLHFHPENGLTEVNSLNTNDVWKQTAVRSEFASIIHVTDKRYWIATTDGLLCLDIGNKNNNTLTWSQHELFNAESLSGNQVISLCKDREGLIWIGTRFNGVNKYDPFKQPFKRFMRRTGEPSTMHSNDVRTLLEDRMGNIWIGYRNEGLDCYTSRSGSYLHFERNNACQDCLPSNVIRGMFEDKNGQLWLGSSAGLTQIIPTKTGYRFETIQLQTEQPPGTVYEFLEDSKGLFWLGTTSGLVLYDRAKNTSKLFRFDDGQDDHSRRFIRCIQEDHQGNIWLATDGKGIIRFNPETGEFNDYRSDRSQSGSLSHDKVYCLLFDSTNRLWVGTHSGLNLWDEKTGTFTVFTELDGLTNNVVYSILEDKEGFLWISSANGLSRFTPSNKTFKNYLHGFEFSDDAWWQNRQGHILFGGLNGFFKFNPQELIDNQVSPNVFLHSFSLQNNVIELNEEVNGRILLEVPLKDAKQIDLSHDENFFSIELRAISLSRPEQIHYQYQLEGFNTQWIDLDARIRTASFTNVPFGHYAFKYRAANADGVSTEESVLQIVIHPALYQTTWFKIALGLLLILLIYVGYRIRLRNLTLQKIRLEQEVEEKTRVLRSKNKAIENQNAILEAQKKEIEEQGNQVMEMTRQIHETDERKIRFFTSISHEIRTPLTLIVSPIEQMLQSLSSQDRQFQSMQMVHRNAQRLLRLVNQLLDFRKMDTGHMPVRALKADLASFVTELFSSFESMAHKKQIAYELHIIPESYEICFDTDVVEKICTNLISNALKYTPEGGNIKVELERKSDHTILFSVQDDGPGIPIDQQESIFKRFWRDQIQPSNQSIGTGIGLALAKELAILHGGDITVQANEKAGSCFRLILPVIDTVEGVPLSDAHFIEQMNNEESEPSQPIESYSVLIIEDNPDLRSFIIESIDTNDVIEAENGDEGIQLALEKMPDIIISDILMPGKNGYEVCRMLKQNDRTNHIPILLLTALGTEENQQIGIQCGADDYIVKPFNPRLLAGKIRNIMTARERYKILLQHELSNSESAKDSNWKQAMPPFIIKLIALVEEHMTDRSFGVEELGKLLGMSRSTLYRKLKTVTNKSAVEFIREVRIRKSLELLQNDPQIQVNELAFLVGFEDVDYFRQCFKKQFGKTPREIG